MTQPISSDAKKAIAYLKIFTSKIATSFVCVILFSLPLGGQTITIDGNPADWPAVLNSSSIPVKVFNHDVANSFTDNIFGLGVNDAQEISSWTWRTGTFISDTRDIENGGAALINDNVYFFGDIIDPTDQLTTFGVWLLLDNVAPTGTSGSGFTGSHTIGDILIVLQISAESETVTVETWEWVGFDASSTGLALLSATTSAAINTIQQPVPVYPGWTYSGAGGPNFYSIKSFFEGYLNVGNLTNRCFKTFLIETRSSSAETASLTDFATGAFGGSADVDNDGFTVCNDCNDNDATINPGANEVCDGIDNDCDGQVDEGLSLTTYYADADDDGFGNPNSSVQACSQPVDYVTNNTDCNDNNDAINPNATEVCDNADNDCDGEIDEGLTFTTYYKDLDGDGFGNPLTTVQRCTPPVGWVTISGDCDDTDAAINPAATEACDGVDNDCDGQIDEELTLITFYADDDGDTYGDPNNSTQACSQPQGYVTNNDDCDDTDAFVNPGATEVCGNGVDDNCNGSTDEGCNPPPVVSINDVSVYESDGTATLTISLSNTSSQNIKVNYQTIDGTAVSKGRNKDFMSAKGSVTIPAGQLSVPVSITIYNDGVSEATESFTVQISLPKNANTATIGDASGTVQIQDGVAPSLTGATLKANPEVKPGIEISELSVRTFPNPATTNFSLIIQAPVHGIAKVEFYSLTGQKVYTVNRHVSANSITEIRYNGPLQFAILVYKVTLKKTVATGIVVKTN